MSAARTGLASPLAKEGYRGVRPNALTSPQPLLGKEGSDATDPCTRNAYSRAARTCSLPAYDRESMGTSQSVGEKDAFSKAADSDEYHKVGA